MVSIMLLLVITTTVGQPIDVVTSTILTIVRDTSHNTLCYEICIMIELIPFTIVAALQLLLVIYHALV